MKNRIWEIDFFRGLAILMMVVYHIFFDLYFFTDFKFVDIENVFLEIVGRGAAILFFLISGLVSYVFFRGVDFKKILNRFLKIFLGAIFVTLITYFFDKDKYVFFGVLHFLAFSTILIVPFLRFRFLNLFIGLFVIIFGFYLNGFTFGSCDLLILGFICDGFATYDYYPILPWFGFILIGSFLGSVFYKEKKSIVEIKENRFIKFMNFIGRNSLLIYLVHQPVLVGVMYLIILF